MAPCVATSVCLPIARSDNIPEPMVTSSNCNSPKPKYIRYIKKKKSDIIDWLIIKTVVDSFSVSALESKKAILSCFIVSFCSTLQLGTVSLALFRTLIGLYCEDVMLQLILRWVAHTHTDLSQLWSMVHLIGLRHDECLLSASHRAELCYHLSAHLPHTPPSFDHPSVFLTGSVPICLPRYLIPCNHMMLSQRRVVRERDCYSVSTAKILALTPSCCSPDHSPPPLRQLDSILFSKGAETPNNTSATGKDI